MLTSLATVKGDRPAYRPFSAQVAAVEQLTPHFRLVRLAGDDLSGFGWAGADQRVKLLVPFADGRTTDLVAGGGHVAGGDVDGGDGADGWYDRWRACPDADRNPIRTLAVRRAGPGWVDLVIAEHGTGGAAGPLAHWLHRVRPGEEVMLVGPDAYSLTSACGIDYHPGEADRVLLVGDETTAPAIASICEQTPLGQRLTALVEVERVADALPVRPPEGVEITWLARGAGLPGTTLGPAVRAWARDALAAGAGPHDLLDVDVDRELLGEAPDAGLHAGFYVWIAAEAGVVRALRRHLVGDLGFDRRRVAFMGYWRRGQAERS